MKILAMIAKYSDWNGAKPWCFTHQPAEVGEGEGCEVMEQIRHQRLCRCRLRGWGGWLDREDKVDRVVEVRRVGSPLHVAWFMRS